MLLKNLDTFRITKTNALLTSYSGLPLIAELPKNITLLHAKMLFLKLLLNYKFFDVFSDARWRTLNFAAVE